MVIATWNGVAIAQSDATVHVDGSENAARLLGRLASWKGIEVCG